MAALLHAAIPYPRHGILLNGSPITHSTSLSFPSNTEYSLWSAKRSPRYASTPLPTTTPTTTSYAASSSSSAQSSPPSSVRKIRFAPLPDPRRAVLITDSGEELPLPLNDEDDDEEGPSTPPDLGQEDWDAISAMKTDSPIEETNWSKHTTSSPYPVTSALPPDSTPATPVEPTSVLGRARRALLKPLTSSSSSPIASTSSKEPSSAPIDARFGSSLDDLRTFGSGMWRTESRESTSTAGGGRKSGSRASSRERTLPDDFGAPLSRSQSSNSAKRSSKRPPSRSSLLSGLRRRSVPDPVPAPPSPAAPPRAIRMLNGHVYGSGKRKNGPIEQKNPFATASAGDEFVEWGYGGAGSVKNAKELGMTANSGLVDDTRVSIGASHANDGTAKKDDDEDDDGSGLTWIRKRKEQKAREAQEKKLAELAEAQKVKEREVAAAAAAVPPPSIEEESVAEGEGTPVPGPVRTELAKETPREEKENVLTSKSVSASESATIVTEPTPALSPAPVAPTQTHRPSYPRDDSEYVHQTLLVPAPHDHTNNNSGLSTPMSESGSSGSSSGSRSPDEERNAELGAGEEDEDEDEDNEVARRATSVGASVEIVSRHKEHA